MGGRMEDAGRFIPARAGNAPWRRPGPFVGPLHPRAGGERSCSGWPRTTGAGSSPRGRGTHEAAGGLLRRLRFIPARAGNAPQKWPYASNSSVHPRAGGERETATYSMELFDGSSPRGRGTLRRRHRNGQCGRFIPARAGNAPRTNRRGSRDTVHPRAGGERPVESPFRQSIVGSSPRGRGTRTCILPDVCV